MLWLAASPGNSHHSQPDMSATYNVKCLIVLLHWIILRWGRKSNPLNIAVLPGLQMCTVDSSNSSAYSEIHCLTYWRGLLFKRVQSLSSVLHLLSSPKIRQFNSYHNEYCCRVLCVVLSIPNIAHMSAHLTRHSLGWGEFHPESGDCWGKQSDLMEMLTIFW